MTEDPRFCSFCGRGPFTRMQGHLNKCQAAIQQERGTTAFFEELRREGRLPAIERLWEEPSLLREGQGPSNPIQRDDSPAVSLDGQTKSGERNNFARTPRNHDVGDTTTQGGESNNANQDK